MTIGRGPEILRIIYKYYQCFDLYHGIDLPFSVAGLLLPHGDKDNRRRVAEGAGIDLKQAKSLTPLPRQRHRAGSARQVLIRAVSPKPAIRGRPLRREARLSKTVALALNKEIT